MVENIPEGDRVVIEPIAPDQWAMDAGRPSAATGTGNRWIKWPTSRFRGRVVKLEDFERTLRTGLLDRYARAGYCHVVTGSTQYGRARTEPEEVPHAIAYYDELRAPRRRRLPRQPARRRAGAAVLVRLLVQQLSARLRTAGTGGRHLPIARLLTRQSIFF